MKRSAQAREVRSPKYRPRVIPDKKKQASKKACRAQVVERQTQ